MHKSANRNGHCQTTLKEKNLLEETKLFPSMVRYSKSYLNMNISTLQ